MLLNIEKCGEQNKERSNEWLVNKGPGLENMGWLVCFSGSANSSSRSDDIYCKMIHSSLTIAFSGACVAQLAVKFHRFLVATGFILLSDCIQLFQ